MLELKDVTAGYEDAVVLRDVSLTVETGSVVALLGPNGAGKTTLLRVASRSLAASEGALALDGQDVSRLACRKLARAGVCHVPEGRSVFPSLTVRENIQIFAGRRTRADAAVEKAVDAFPALGRLLGRTAGTMSGGEQQMLALSRAYIAAPRLVLLDEVSLGLAPRIVDELFLFIERLASEGVSLLVVEQYIDRALAIADHVYLLNRGRIAFSGKPADLDAGKVLHNYVGVD